MGVPRPDNPAERPLDNMVQTVSEQAVVLARKELELARSELTSKAKQAAGGAAMLGGAALLGTLAAGTGTAGLVLLLSRRPGPSAAALGVAGAYAIGGAGLAQGGISRLRPAAPPVPEETVESVEAVKRPKKTVESVEAVKRPKMTKKKPRPRRPS
jgi:Putative Actinobacterial Holin-X, holin superfamily III